jgi:hypothetical protein
MINSAILLLLLHYSLLNAQSRSRTHDIKKQTTFTKKKREKHSSHERKHQLTKSTKSLSLSLSLHVVGLLLSFCVKSFFLSKNFGENVLKRGSQKTKNLLPFLTFVLSRLLSRAPRQRELLPGKLTLLARKNTFSFIKIMFAPARMMMRSNAAPTHRTTHNQNKTHNFHPKRLPACKGIRRQRRCRVPLVAMSIPQQGGNAQPRESYCCFLSFSLSRVFLVFLVFAR